MGRSVFWVDVGDWKREGRKWECGLWRDEERWKEDRGEREREREREGIRYMPRPFL